MVDIYITIKELSGVARLSKHEQIVKGIITAIEDKLIERGQLLPSINQMSSELGYARKTIHNAYKELKDRGLIESRNRRGYFVSTDLVDQTVRVALVLYEFRPFQEMFYNVFRQSVGDNVQVDTFFHHNNLSVFEDIITKIAGRYGLCIVAPIIDDRVPGILSILVKSRLLLVDRYVDLGDDRPYVIQEFESSTLSILNGLLERIRDYKRIEIFFRQDSEAAYPVEILSAVRRFSTINQIELSVKERHVQDTVEEGVLYLTIGDNDLWSLLEDCLNRNYVPGKNIGILSHNENRIKRIIHGGISTWSTDFSLMAEEAAKWVLERGDKRQVIPTVYIDRNSF